jgi:choice-of-anchor A domain-containing protein
MKFAPLSLLAIGLSATLHAQTQCPGTPGHVLTVAPLTAIGSPLEATITTPADRAVLLYASKTAGPMSTPIGTLCLGSDLFPILVVMGTNKPVTHTYCELRCVDILVGVKTYLQFVAVNLRDIRQIGLSNGTCFTITQPLGVGQDFSLFVCDDIAADNVEFEGRIASGDDVTLKSVKIGTKLANSAGKRDDLICDDDLVIDTVEVRAGNAVYGDTVSTSKLTIPNGKVRKQAQLIDWPVVCDFMKTQSALLATVPNAGNKSISNGVIKLTGTNKTQNVFTCTAQQITDANEIRIEAPASATVLVNIIGDRVDMTGLKFTVVTTNSQQILFNMPVTTWLKLHDTTIQGTVLAPCAEAWFKATLNGRLLLYRLDDATGGKIVEKPFCGCIRVPARTR